MEASRNLLAALAYARLGFKVFPVHTRSKIPATANGFKDANSDVALINTLWGGTDFGIGIATGQRSGFVVLDVDPRNGGHESLQALVVHHGPLPPTVTALTGGGGTHFLFTCAVPCGTRCVAPGIDLKGDGGYIVAPFSIHPSGKAYEWVPGWGPTGSNMAPIPDWLLDHPAAPSPSPSSAQLSEGYRNKGLFNLACSLRHKGLSHEAIEAALQIENTARCDPPLTSNEVCLVARSAARYDPGKLPDGPTMPIVVRATDVIDKPAPKIPWAIEGILAEGDIAILSGAPGVGKSWLAYVMSVSLATGRSLFEHWPISRPYTIAILDLETRSWELDLRLQRLAQGMKLKSSDFNNLVLFRKRMRLDDHREVAALRAVLEEHGVDFVVIDSFRRMTSMDLNKAENVAGIFARILDPLRLSPSHPIGSIIIDHNRKLTGEPALDAPDQALTGSHDKMGMVDALFGLQPREERIAFIPKKTRHSKLPEGCLIEIIGLEDEEDDECPVSIRYAGALDTASNSAQDAILALLRGVGTKGMLRGELIGRSKYSMRTVAAAIAALRRRKLIISRDEPQQAKVAGSRGAQKRYFVAP